jgi:AraC-like DNA-binding protein
VSEAGTPVAPDLPPGVLRGPARGHFRLQHRPAGPAVRDVVETYWIVEWAVPPGEERVQQVVTNPCVHLSVEADEARVTGVVTRAFERTLVGRGRVVGVRFRPGGFAALHDGPAADLTDRVLPVAAVLGAEAAAELAPVGTAPGIDDAVRALAGILERRRRPLPEGAVLVDLAVDHIVARSDVTRVDQVASHLGVSPRTLQRRFDRYLGVGPKWVIQRHRIHEALGEIEQGRAMDWSRLAVRLGFADQAHFVNAFTDLVGQPPSRYEARSGGAPGDRAASTGRPPR